MTIWQALKNHLTNTFGIDFMVTSMGVQLDGDITLEIPDEAAKGCGFEVIPDMWPCLVRMESIHIVYLALYVYTHNDFHNASQDLHILCRFAKRTWTYLATILGQMLMTHTLPVYT